MTWARSKTVWGAAIIAAAAVGKYLWPESALPDLVLTLGGGLGLVGMRHAVSKAASISRKASSAYEAAKMR